MGRQRIPAHVRRLPAARRAPRRPVRPTPPVPGGRLAVHDRLDRVRPVDGQGAPDRRARRPGSRRRGRLGRRALADHGALRRAGRARQGDGRVRLRDGRRRQPRGAARRHPHRRAQLALDLPGQRADRRRRLRARGAPRPGVAREPALRRARRRRCGDRHGGADACRVRDRQRQPGRLGLAADARVARARRRPAGGLPVDRVARRGAADAAPPVPPPQRRDGERRRRAVGGGDVRLVLPLRAVPAARARLQPARRSASRSCPRTSSWPSSRSGFRRSS